MINLNHWVKRCAYFYGILFLVSLVELFLQEFHFEFSSFPSNVITV